MVMMSTHTHNWATPVNVLIALAVGIAVGMVEEVPIEMIPDAMIFGLAAGFFLQEVILIQYMHHDLNLKFQERLLMGKATSFNRRIALFGPLVFLFAFGILMLMLSDRDVDAVAVARIACVAVIITLGLDPLSGLLHQSPVAMVGAVVIYTMVIFAGMDNYPELAVTLKGHIGTFSAVTCSSIVLTYLLLSSRWTYYRLFCFEQAHEWKFFLLDTGLPLLFILSPKFFEVGGLVAMVYVGTS